MKMSLQMRGLSLVIIPIVLQVIFSVVVCCMLAEAQKLQEQGVVDRELKFELNKFQWDLIDELVFLDGPDENDPGVNTTVATGKMMQMMAQMNVLLKKVGNEVQTERMRNKIDEMFTLVNYAVKHLAIKSNPRTKTIIRKAVFQSALRILPAFLDESARVLFEHDRLLGDSLNKSKIIENQVFLLIGFAVITSLLTALGLAYNFRESIRRPLQHIAENSRRLSKKTPLLPALQGGDELSALDRYLHQTADAVITADKREHALIDNVGDLICSLDKDGVFMEANSAAHSMLGISREALIGQTLSLLVVARDSLLADEHLRKACESLNDYNFELSLHGGSTGTIETQWSCIWSPLRKRIFCVVRDITAEKALSRMKQDFVDMVSHDLRSPLTSLGIALEIIESGSLGEINHESLKEVQSTNSNVQILIGFINDLLDFQKLDEGRIHLEKDFCSTREMIRETVALVKEVADQRQVAIETTPLDFEVLCDRQKVIQALLNLLSNAIKFSPAGGVIKITAQQIEESTRSLVRIAVSDNGPGVPESLRERIFEPFEQAPTARQQGTGLGLAICKMIVEAHGGRIAVTANETAALDPTNKTTSSSGSTFWLTLPVTESDIAPPPATAHSQNLFEDEEQ